MFGFTKKQKDLRKLINNIDKYQDILRKLSHILAGSGHSGQAEVISNLIIMLEKNNFTEFEKSINSVDMWGGAGAVWEVYIEDQKTAKDFEQRIINLIDLMENTEILGNGIKPIRKIFRKNLDK